MNPLNLQKHRRFVRHAALLLVLSGIVSGCATSGSTVTPARIEIEEEVGFTISEEVRISSNVRMDYEQALALLQQGRFGAVYLGTFGGFSR